jgi:hypothetical protein
MEDHPRSYDYGVTNEVVLDADGDDLKIELEISAIKVQPAAAA